MRERVTLVHSIYIYVSTLCTLSLETLALLSGQVAYDEAVTTDMYAIFCDSHLVEFLTVTAVYQLQHTAR